MKKVPLFAGCSKRELAELATLADEIDLAEGKELTKEGAIGREFFVLIEGTAEVRRKKKKIATLGPGDFLGEIALVHRSPRTATVKATSPVRVLVVTEGKFRNVLERHPQIQLKVLQALAERLAPTSL